MAANSKQNRAALRVAVPPVLLLLLAISLILVSSQSPSQTYLRRRGRLFDSVTQKPVASSASTNDSSSDASASESGAARSRPLNFDHQDSGRLPVDPVVAKYCAHVQPWQLHEAVLPLNLTILSDPVALHFTDGKPIAEGRSYGVETGICTVYLVPQTSRSNTSELQNLPVDGWGPDSIHAEIESEHIRIMLQSPMFWGFMSMPGSSFSRTADLAVYLAAFSLNHPGTYQLHGEVEFGNWDWVMENNIDLTAEPLPYVMFNHTIVPSSPAITITGAPVSRPTQKCFHDGSNDLRGRWYKASSFAHNGSQTLLNFGARLDFADHNNTVDKWGWTFAPDDCQLTYFSAEDHMSCLDSRTIQVLGDSNSRRVLKSIMGGGISWCQDPDERMCQCEDHWQTEFQDVNWRTVNATYFKDVDSRADPITFGRNTSAYFDFIGGLLNQKLFNGWFYFYDSSPSSPSIVTKRQQEHGPIDVVHVSVIGWDMASVRTPNEWIAAFENFRHTLLTSYPPGTRFVHRLANNMCCGNQNHRTRYSAPRFAMWNALYRRWWQQDENAGLHRVIDVTAIQGRADAEMQFYCPTTHMRSSHVRIEQMMWMSAVCDKARDGSVSMRNDFGLPQGFNVDSSVT